MENNWKEKGLTGYPSIDKPWLKYYKKGAADNRMSPKTIYEFIYDYNKNNLDDIAILYFNKKITYNSLFDQIKKCAESLTTLGVKAGDIVTIQTLTIPQTAVLLYSISCIGAVANFIYISDEEKDVNENLRKTNSRLYFVLDSVYEKFSSVTDNTNVEKVIILSIDTDMDLITKTLYNVSNNNVPKITNTSNIMMWNEFMKIVSSESINYVQDKELPVVMVYTGGTTGKSKAVVLTNTSLNQLIFQYKNSSMEFIRQDVFMDSLPPFIAFGLVVGLHLPLSMGFKTALIPDPTPQNQGNVFFKYLPNYYVASPLQIQSIFDNPKAEKTDFSFLRILGTGGDALPAHSEENINKFLSEHNSNISIIQGYGMSELSATVCTGMPNAIKFGAVGIPLPGTCVKIIDTESGDELQYNQQGEVCINTSSVMLGYYNAEEETNKILRTHKDGKKWIHTGDIGYMDQDGFLKIVGRIKRIITISDGSIYHKVFPKVLEEQLETLDGVTSVVIVSNATYVDEQILIAYVVASGNNTTVIEDKLREYANNNFKDYEKPNIYKFIESLPRTKIGKVDYRYLEKLAADA